MRFTTFFILLFFIACTPKRGKVTYKEGGEIKNGSAKLRCEPPKKRYTKELESKVKLEIESLANVPASDLEFSLANKVIRLADYSSIGLDKDLVLFRICEMSINRGMTSDQTYRLIEQTIKTWDNSTLPRKLEAFEKKEILENIEIEKNKISCLDNCKIIVQYPEVATDGKSFGDEVVSFLKENGFENIKLQSAIAAGGTETEFTFSSLGHTIWLNIPKRRG